ncbi:hypothetical protein ACFL5Z_19165 [Planctomycetota bacterium]
MLTTEQEKELSVKQGIEYFAFKYFSVWQHKEYLVSFDFERFGEPPEPDIFALWNNHEIGIEVGTLYSGNFDAARLLGRIEDEDFKDKLQEEVMIPLDRVYVRLRNLINSKQEKEYSVTNSLLLIQNAFPLFSKEDFLCVEGIYDCGQFREIWLVCDRSGDSGILRLDKYQK